MATQLIRLSDGTLVEVEIDSDDRTELIAGGSARRVDASRLVDATLDKLTPILVKTCKPIAAAWIELKKTTEVNQIAKIDSAEIELGLSFEIEGDLYIAKSKAGANIKVKLTLKEKG